MKIKSGLLFSCLIVAGLVFVGFTPQSYAKAVNKKLFDDSALACSGKTVGKVSLSKIGSQVQVIVKITKGSKNATRTVYWVCQSGSDCHSGCGYVSIGTIKTNAKGKGKFKWKGTAPYTGTVHFDIMDTGNYYAGIFTVPASSTVETSPNAVEGDPTQQ